MQWNLNKFKTDKWDDSPLKMIFKASLFFILSTIKCLKFVIKNKNKK
jgi:hypothetical protein